MHRLYPHYQYVPQDFDFTFVDGPTDSIFEVNPESILTSNNSNEYFNFL